MTIFHTKIIENNNMQSNKVIELSSVSKKYPLIKQGHRNIKTVSEDFWALKDVSLDIRAGEILGIIGRNGAGKTTLLNIISGVLSSTEGKINLFGKVLGLFNLGAGFQDELTGRENIFLNGAIMGATRDELKNKLDSIMDFSELGNFINMPLGSYSQGMRLRLGFSIIANLDFDVLVIDEVLAVGDALFQNKCFERLMDFKRSGKTMVITTQNLDLIERLSDRVALLDHGRLLFLGSATEGISRYRILLNTSKFFVGSDRINTNLIENTKKWADDKSNWGKALGTKEVVINKVRFMNRFGWEGNRIKSGQRLRIKVYFSARNKIHQPHFGIAVLRNDGVYCYGPNTHFDGYKIPDLKQGIGYFVLDFHKMLLGPGEYRISVAIWDKTETLAFNYHEGCYKLTVKGKSNGINGLLKMPFRFAYKNCKDLEKVGIDISILNDKWGQKTENDEVKLNSIKLLNSSGEEKDAFLTNESVSLVISFSNLINYASNLYLWIGFYRSDGIYCQGAIQPLNNAKIYKVYFSKLPLLPGGYSVSFGIWDLRQQKFVMCYHPAHFFRMVFNREDHGTIYLDHNWGWKLPIEK
jgi:lipopolysaccharide transport system ATP-binding protein